MTRGARLALALHRRGKLRTFRLPNGLVIHGRFRVTPASWWQPPDADWCAIK